MKKLTPSFVKRVSLATTAAIAAPLAALAVESPFTQAQKLTNDVGTQAGVSGTQTLPVIVGKIINVSLGFIGIVLLVLLLLAGFNWMTAGGDADKVKKAQAQIKNAIIGLIIIVAAFAISNFVLSSLINVAQ